MLRHALAIVRTCLQRGIPGYLENPASSLIWNVGGIKKLLLLPGVHLIRTHMCQFGAPMAKNIVLSYLGAQQQPCLPRLQVV